MEVMISSSLADDAMVLLGSWVDDVVVEVLGPCSSDIRDCLVIMLWQDRASVLTLCSCNNIFNDGMFGEAFSLPWTCRML